MLTFDVIGAGSMGLLLAGTLAQAGHRVTVVSRTEEQAEAISAAGITVSGPAADSVFVSRPEALSFSRYEQREAARPADWILLTVKQRDLTEEWLRRLSALYSEGTGLAAFQNGLGHMEKLMRHFPSRSICAAVTTEGASRMGLSGVAHTGRGITWVGRLNNDSNPADQVADEGLHPSGLAAALSLAGFAASVPEDISTEIWYKLLINAVINPLTAILGVRNGELLQSAAARSLMKTLYEEGVLAARKLGIRLSEDLWDRIIRVCEATAANHSSMLQDLRAGRKTEIDWINGSLLHEAERVGLLLHAHQMVYHLMKAKEELEAEQKGGDA